MLKWKDDFSVKVSVLDDQHKELFNLGNKIYNALKTEKEDKYDEIVRLLDELEEYTRYHFKTEEKLLEKYGAVVSDEHKKEHEDFVIKLMEAKTRDLDSNQEKVLYGMLNFVADWITNHILNTDKEYSQPLNEKGIY